MERCKVEGSVGEIAELLLRLSDGVVPSEASRVRLTQLLDRWDAATCPSDVCVPGNCPFRRATDPWIQFHGFANLYDLIMKLEQRKPIDRIPANEGVDAFDARWARRPGHYNP